jgi:hypothetical protein
MQLLAFVTLPPAGAGRKPCSDCADQRGRTDHGAEDDRGMPGARNILPRPRDDTINTLLRFRLAKLARTNTDVY